MKIMKKYYIYIICLLSFIFMSGCMQAASPLNSTNDRLITNVKDNSPRIGSILNEVDIHFDPFESQCRVVVESFNNPDNPINIYRNYVFISAWTGSYESAYVRGIFSRYNDSFFTLDDYIVALFDMCSLEQNYNKNISDLFPEMLELTPTGVKDDHELSIFYRKECSSASIDILRAMDIIFGIDKGGIDRLEAIRKIEDIGVARYTEISAIWNYARMFGMHGSNDGQAVISNTFEFCVRHHDKAYAIGDVMKNLIK